MPPLVRFDRVTKDFAEGSRVRHVLRDADLEVAAGEIVAIRGRSGSGRARSSTWWRGSTSPPRAR
jgi:macrolide transport system ATP-binding/permease protein